jgi:hypothetical protein
MIFQFTAAGEAAFLANPSLVQVTRVVLGSGVNYTLADPPVNIQGSSVYDSSVAWTKETIDANNIRFSRVLDSSVGNFQFGEAALYDGATIIAVGVSSTLITKTQAAGAEQGNKITLSFFATQSNANAYGFLTQANSDSSLQLPNAIQLDTLKPPYSGEPNSYIVNGLTPEDRPCIAFSDLYGRWNFTDKPALFYEGAVSGTPTQTALDIATPHGVTFLTPENHVLQWISGRLRGYVRRLSAINSTSFAWVTPLSVLPEVGDEFIIVGPEVGDVVIQGQANIQFQDEGSNLGTAGTVTSVNFTGVGVTASRASNAVTIDIPGGGGGSSSFYAKFDNIGFGSTSGTPFENWSVSEFISTSFATVDANGVISLNSVGAYKITINYFMEPDAGVWPSVFTTYGTRILGTAYPTGFSEQHTAHVRDNTDSGLNQINSFVPSAPAPHNLRDTDVYFVKIPAADTFTPQMYAARYGGSEDMLYEMTVSIEFLGNDFIPPGY